ncbi:hypothetical protein MC885_021321 [Smutsia gigantea]|nr:hypothetical protein MC885_021321 [Smutsia gigantea]
MAGPQGCLLLCFLAFCLAGSGFIRGQVWSRRCDMKTKSVTRTPCTTCPAIKKQACPPGWLREFPEKISQDCRYEVQLGDSVVSMSGCSLECWKDMVQKACCPGYWGSQCYECPGGAKTPCNGRGTCLDGMDRNGTCVCQEHFSGSACQQCRDPDRFGPDCRSGQCPPSVCLSQCAAVCMAYVAVGRLGTEAAYALLGTLDPAVTKASCSCKPGLASKNYNASAGCSAYCFPHSCDRSATCQVTPDGKTSCVCKEGEVGDGRACYGHLLHEIRKADQMGMVFLRQRLNLAMLEQGCREILTTSGPFTVLVPSDSYSSSRTTNASLARQLCRQHIVAGQHMLEESGSQQSVRWWTLAGQEVTIAFHRYVVRGDLSLRTIAVKVVQYQERHGGMGPWDGAGMRSLRQRPHALQKYTYKNKDPAQETFTVYKANYPAANGIFHVVTTLWWQPPSEPPEDSKRTIGQILASTEAFSRFETILENCGLPSILDGPGPFTVFVPSNEAVDRLRDGRLIYLFTAGLSKLQELVRHHIYSHSQLTVEKLISKGRVVSMASQVIAVNVTKEGRILLGPEGVPLRRVDLLASNGVIHMLDGVLLPPTILPILPKLCSEEQHQAVVGSCTDCQALSASTCPPGSVKLVSTPWPGAQCRLLSAGGQDIFPEECVYVHDPAGLNVLKKGCAHHCNQTILKPGCCRGFFGPDCAQCPGGFSNPCYGKGNCSDGAQGNGACLCFPDFKGIACHICSNPKKHGDKCQEVTSDFVTLKSSWCWLPSPSNPFQLHPGSQPARPCLPPADCGCVHGICDNRPGSGGVCQRGTCAPGFSGPFCNESAETCGPTELAQRCHLHARCVSQGGTSRCLCLDGFEGDGFSCAPSSPCSRPDRGGCAENVSQAECVPGVLGTPHCMCHKGWSGDGRVCVAIDECELDARGGCHTDALCSYVGPGQSRCTCKLGFAGDGYVCSPIDPCRAGNGGCHDLATCQAVGGGQRVCTCPPGYGGDGFSCYGDIFQELEAHAHFSVFYQWVKGAGVTLPASSRVTALVPSESAIRRLSPEDQAFWLRPKMLPQLVRAHFLQGTLSEEELARLGGQEVATLSPTVRWEIHNISGRVWVQNASVDVADLLATNGVLHILSQVLLPPREAVLRGRALLQLLDSVPAFHVFRDLLQLHGLVPQIEAATAYTIFVPTNRSLEARSNSSGLDADTVRHHVVLGEALSAEALRRGGHRHSLLGPAHWLVFYSHSGQPEVNRVLLEGPELEAPGGSLFGLSGVLTVGSSRCLHSHTEALREKCVNCTRKFRCTQGFQLEDTPKKSCVYRSGYSFSWGCSYTCAKKIQVCPEAPLPIFERRRLQPFPTHPCHGEGCRRSSPSPGIQLALLYGSVPPCPTDISLLHLTRPVPGPSLRPSRQVPDCCPGYFGTLCEPCPGGRGGVCSGHGQCQDGLLGSGECRCHEGFHGTACEACELGRYGPHCAGVCDCEHGLCQEGLRGDGRCVCNVGWQGLRCDQKITGPQCLERCDPNANCEQDSASAAPACVCAAGYSGDGVHCSEVDPCARDHGGCSPHANCTKVAPGQRTCTCQDGYAGDGELCQEINSCLTYHGGCHIHAECIPTGPQQVSCSCREGYGGDGIRTCEPLDPCSQSNGGCSPYAMCKSTGPGQRTCTCDAAHTVGDGFTCRGRVGLELLRDRHASFFGLHLLEYKELKGKGPFTVFVPHADLMTNLSREELARIRAHRQLVFRYHVVGCLQLRSQELLEAGYATALSGQPLRFSEREGSIYINDFARVVSSDHEAVNGVLHFIDRALLPPDALHWEPGAAPAPRRDVTAAAESFGYASFSHLVRAAGLLPLLQDVSHRPLTMLWPTDSALRALPPERQAWLYHEDHRDKLAAILRGHVIRNTEALASDLPNLGPLRTMHGTPVSFSCSRARPGELTVGEDGARIVQRHLPFEGGLAYGIDQLLEPPGLGARCDTFETRPLQLKLCSICGLEPPCPEGSQEQGSPKACWRYSKFWTSPALSSVALRGVWAQPGLGRGCQRNCVRSTWKPGCCPGHYGSECRACPGGASSPCSGHGVCVDGMSGSGQCRCLSGFAGSACELCAPGAFGPHCQACRCTVHGHCDQGLGGSGSCFCEEGWTGPRCEVQLGEWTSGFCPPHVHTPVCSRLHTGGGTGGRWEDRWASRRRLLMAGGVGPGAELQPVCSPTCASQAMCRAGNSCECSLGYEGDGRTCTVADLCQGGRGGCSEHANCSQIGTVVICKCLPDYEGDGWSCRARDACADGYRGGCSEHADCLSTGPNTRRCACRTGYVGDGLQCVEEPEPPVDRCLGQPRPCHVDAVCTDLHFQEKRAGVFHLQAAGGRYSLNFSEARAACGAQGAVLASLAQLSAAQQLGFHLCLAGWLADGSAAHPVVFPASGCGDGRVGVVSLGTRQDLSERWDAYCYREQDVACQCRGGFVGDGTSVCNGKLLDVLAATADFSTFYGMLLRYANATPRGLDFLDFLDDELTYKTLFVPVNEGFVDNVTLSGPDLELHASNATFLSTNASQGTLLPAHSGHRLVISDVGRDNSSGASVVPGTVAVSHVIVWDIVASNGIIHALASPLLAPLQPRAVVALESPAVAAGVGAVVAAGALLSLVAGGLYLRARGKATGFSFRAFQVEDDADDDFSPWQEGTSPTLVSVPNPIFGSHDAFCEPFDDSLLGDFPDTQRILAVK